MPSLMLIILLSCMICLPISQYHGNLQFSKHIGMIFIAIGFMACIMLLWHILYLLYYFW